MTNKPKIHGYIDSEALLDAVEANETLTSILPKIIDELDHLPRAAALRFQRVGFELARQRASLARMERIRASAKGKTRKA